MQAPNPFIVKTAVISKYYTSIIGVHIALNQFCYHFINRFLGCGKFYELHYGVYYFSK